MPSLHQKKPSIRFRIYKNILEIINGHIGFYCNVMKYGTSAVELGDSELLLEIEQFCSDQKNSFSPSSTVLFLGCSLFSGASKLNEIIYIEPIKL